MLQFAQTLGILGTNGSLALLFLLTKNKTLAALYFAIDVVPRIEHASQRFHRRATMPALSPQKSKDSSFRFHNDSSIRLMILNGFMLVCGVGRKSLVC